MSNIPSITVSDVALDQLETPLLVVPIGKESLEATGELTAVDAATNGALGRALSRRDFRGGRDETLLLGGTERGIQRVLLVGTGPATTGDASGPERALQIRRACMIAGRQANKLGVGALAFFGATNDEQADRGTSRR